MEGTKVLLNLRSYIKIAESRGSNVEEKEILAIIGAFYSLGRTTDFQVEKYISKLCASVLDFWKLLLTYSAVNDEYMELVMDGFQAILFVADQLKVYDHFVKKSRAFLKLLVYDWKPYELVKELFKLYNRWLMESSEEIILETCEKHKKYILLIYRIINTTSDIELQFVAMETIWRLSKLLQDREDALWKIDNSIDEGSLHANLRLLLSMQNKKSSVIYSLKCDRIHLNSTELLGVKENDRYCDIWIDFDLKCEKVTIICDESSIRSNYNQLTFTSLSFFTKDIIQFNYTTHEDVTQVLFEFNILNIHTNLYPNNAFIKQLYFKVVASVRNLEENSNLREKIIPRMFGRFFNDKIKISTNEVAERTKPITQMGSITAANREFLCKSISPLSFATNLLRQSGNNDNIGALRNSSSHSSSSSNDLQDSLKFFAGSRPKTDQLPTLKIDLASGALDFEDLHKMSSEEKVRGWLEENESERSEHNDVQISTSPTTNAKTNDVIHSIMTKFRPSKVPVVQGSRISCLKSTLPTIQPAQVESIPPLVSVSVNPIEKCREVKTDRKISGNKKIEQRARANVQPFRSHGKRLSINREKSSNVAVKSIITELSNDDVLGSFQIESEQITEISPKNNEKSSSDDGKNGKNEIQEYCSEKVAVLQVSTTQASSVDETVSIIDRFIKDSRNIDNVGEVEEVRPNDTVTEPVIQAPVNRHKSPSLDVTITAREPTATPIQTNLASKNKRKRKLYTPNDNIVTLTEGDFPDNDESLTKSIAVTSNNVVVTQQIMESCKENNSDAVIIIDDDEKAKKKKRKIVKKVPAKTKELIMREIEKKYKELDRKVPKKSYGFEQNQKWIESVNKLMSRTRCENCSLLAANPEFAAASSRIKILENLVIKPPNKKKCSSCIKWERLIKECDCTSN